MRSNVDRGEGMEALYSAVQCNMGSGYLVPSPQPSGQTDTTENITFSYLREMTICNNIVLTKSLTINILLFCLYKHRAL